MPGKPGYWIMFHHDLGCPLCGGGSSGNTQERIYDRPKPLEWNARHLYHESYDYCIEFAGLYA